MNTPNLKGLTLPELQTFVTSIGEQKYRGKQLFDWLYTKEASSFGEMSSLSKPLRSALESAARIESMRLIEAQISDSDGTEKFLFELHDGKRIESVLIPPKTAFKSADAGEEEEQKRLTLCISTQVGCPLDCTFCATATMGFHRNLTAGEIVDQLLQVKKISGKRVTNIVYMGMGEPMLNYEQVMNSADIFAIGCKIAAKRITLSTAGWVPSIRRMADEKRKMKLAISLHTLDDGKRSELMPINVKYPLSDLLAAAKYYYAKCKERITFEYILFDGWNDGEADIRKLVRLTNDMPCKINIIPFHSIAFTNPTGIARTLKPTSAARAGEFVRRLREAHVTVFVRSSAGEDIDAACGQLAVTLERKRRAHATVMTK